MRMLLLIFLVVLSIATLARAEPDCAALGQAMNEHQGVAFHYMSLLVLTAMRAEGVHGEQYKAIVRRVEDAATTPLDGDLLVLALRVVQTRLAVLKAAGCPAK